MVILLLSEPRSGSNNLTNWFYFHKDFTTWFVPSDLKSKWYQSISPSEYSYNTKHLFIKEDYYQHKDYSEFINISDKIICLYRENEFEQIESWINARKTNNWSKQWAYVKGEFKFDEKDANFFKELKKSFREQYLNDLSYFKISYEELYNRNGFQKILNYLDIEELENKNFPYGQKYRVEVDNSKTLI
jgi:LPS sulfotransferase NodH